MRRFVVGITTAALIGVVLTGCAGQAAVPPAVTDDGWFAAARIGTATFADNTAGVSGTVVLLSRMISANESDLMLSFAEVTFAKGTAGLTGSLTPLPARQECLIDDGTIDFEVQEQPIDVASMTDSFQDDPTLLRTIVLSVPVNGSVDASPYVDASQLDTPCAWIPVAQASISWSLADRHPSLVATDSGSRSGANGSVTLREGRPGAYVIAAGDNASAIAARFGISNEELEFLNPYFDFGDYFEAGDILVLDTLWRGLNVNQRNGFGTPGWIAPAQ